MRECQRHGHRRAAARTSTAAAGSSRSRARRIRFGLGAVKGVGEAAIEAILDARLRVGRFRGLYHLATEVDTRVVNHKVFECLVKAGCFDPLGFPRGALFDRLDAVIEAAQRCRREREEGQSSLFAVAGEEPEPPLGNHDFPSRQRLQHEREALGLYLTGNPLEEHEPVLRRRITHTATDLPEAMGATVTLGGLLTRLRQNKIKTGPNAGRFMGRFVLADLDGDVGVLLFSDQLEKNRRLLIEDTVVLVTGQVRDSSGDIELRAERIESLEEVTAGDVEVELELARHRVDGADARAAQPAVGASGAGARGAAGGAAAGRGEGGGGRAVPHQARRRPAAAGREPARRRSRDDAAGAVDPRVGEPVAAWSEA